MADKNWWLWQMYNQVARFINNPCSATDAKLQMLIEEYRKYYRKNELEVTDPHERLMDYN